MNFFYIFSAAVGEPCSRVHQGSFLAFPTWYRYLQGQYINVKAPDGSINLVCDNNPHLTSLSDIWLVVAAIIEILLRVAVLAAVVFIIYGGITFITSEGDPEKTKTARNTIINALIGLGIAVMASAIIAFIAGSIT